MVRIAAAIEFAMKRMRQFINIMRGGWSFEVTAFYADRGAALVGDDVTLVATIRNNGQRTGTAYVRFFVADSYDLTNPIFDSDRDLSLNERRALRLVDIDEGQERRGACTFRVSQSCLAKHFDVRVQVWNPQKLFGAEGEWKFYDSGWRGMFEVIQAANQRYLSRYSSPIRGIQRLIATGCGSLLKSWGATTYL